MTFFGILFLTKFWIPGTCEYVCVSICGFGCCAYMGAWVDVCACMCPCMFICVTPKRHPWLSFQKYYNINLGFYNLFIKWIKMNYKFGFEEFTMISRPKFKFEIIRLHIPQYHIQRVFS